MVRTVERKSCFISIQSHGKKKQSVERMGNEGPEPSCFSSLFFIPPTEDLMMGGLKLVDWGGGGHV